MKNNRKNNSKSTRQHSVVEALESRIAPAFVSANFDLGAITAAIGSGIGGAGPGENFGHSVSDAGDVNGDGIGDLIIGAPFAGSGGGTQGAAYIVFGKEGGVPFPLSAGSLNSSNIVALYGEADGDQFGTSVAAAGDVNGDGFADLIVGAPKAAGNSIERGEAYVIYGHGGTFPTTFNVSSLDGKNGFEVIGTHTMDHLGASVAGAGDFNGDGLADVLVGATEADGDAVHSGAAYVIYGKSGSRSNVFTSIMQAADGVKLSGIATGDFAGGKVAGGGDVNGDGYSDVIVGAQLANGGGATRGVSYVVFGSAGFGTNQPLSGLGGANGFRLLGAGDGDQAGASVAILNDLNGDGLAEIGVGAPLNNDAAGDAGAAYVVFGKSSSFGTTVTLGTQTGADGFKLTGSLTADLAGTSIHSAGDVNGDGHGDLIVGAFSAHIGIGQIPGAAYVVFGKDGAFNASTSLNSLTIKDGLILKGATSGSATGVSVSSAGDVNHDGFADLLVGAEFSGNGQAGSARIVYGGPSGTFVDPVYSNNGHTATFMDNDGDKVTVNVTKGDLHNADFDLLAGDGTHASFLKLQLNNTFDGANLTIKAMPTAAGGDGHVNLGFLDATGVDLGAVTVPGNVEHFTIGNAATPAAAVKNLTVGSLGVGTLPVHDIFGDTYVSQLAGKSGAVTVKGDINTASLTVGGNLASLTVGGSIIGGDTLFSGLVQTTAGGSIGKVKIGHDLRGGEGTASGGINAAGNLGAVTIGGSQIGGDNFINGYLIAGGDIASVSIGHDQVNAEISSLGKIGSVKVGGSLLVTEAAAVTGIHAKTSVGAVTVKGDIVGLAGTPYIIEGGGALTGKTSVAVKSVSVGGSVANSDILGGLAANNSHAQIGAITVNGNWTASSIVAGAKTNAGNVTDPIFFGNADDTALTGGTSTAIARIASIVIKGEVHGTAGGGDHFGFVAQQIGSVKIGAVKYKLAKNTTDVFEIGDTSDFTIRELA
ncbi:MAG TPA: integrin alpha [Chthoniobacteraceae bacterium]|nr:integrin alpha [Chthoniobacteraceae bacterium]